MGEKYLIDTNVLIDAQMGQLPKNGLRFLAQATQEFIALASIIEIDKKIIDICIDLRKSNRIKLPDAIIAATALGNDITIITNNERDFDKIVGIRCINPHKI